MVYIPICHFIILPFADESWQFLLCMVSKSSHLDQSSIKLIHNVKVPKLSFASSNIIYTGIIMWKLLPFVS